MVVLCVGLLHQGAPVLVAGSGVAEEEPSLPDGQPVVHHHVHPLPKLPELRTHAGQRAHDELCLAPNSTTKLDLVRIGGITGNCNTFQQNVQSNFFALFLHRIF